MELTITELLKVELAKKVAEEKAKDVFYPNVGHPHYVATCK